MSLPHASPSHTFPRSPRLAHPGFSLVEMLIVLAVISLLAALGMGYYGRYQREVVMRVRDQRNAQEVSALVMGAHAAGAPVPVAGDLEATVRALVEGRQGTAGTFRGKMFKLSNFAEEDIPGALRFLSWQEGFPACVPASN